MRKLISENERRLTPSEREDFLFQLEQTIEKVRSGQLVVDQGDIVTSLRDGVYINTQLTWKKPASGSYQEKALQLITAWEAAMGKGAVEKDRVDVVDVLNDTFPPIIDPKPTPIKPPATLPGPIPSKKYTRSEIDALLVTLNETGADPKVLGGVCHMESDQSSLWNFGPIVLEENKWGDSDGNHVQWTDDVALCDWDSDVVQSIKRALEEVDTERWIKNTEKFLRS